jgi:hypothetical protein
VIALSAGFPRHLIPTHLFRAPETDIVTDSGGETVWQYASCKPA